MITLGNIIADVSSDLKMYAESGLIDEISLRIHLLNLLKGFGGNVMEIYPYIIEIKNSQGKLPDNFFSLVKAVKTEPIGYEPMDGCDEGELISSYFYRVRKEASKIWDNQSRAFNDGEYKEVTEKTYLFDKRYNARFHYGNSTILKLVRGFDKSKLSEECENIRIIKSPYEINIINNTIQTNFNNGFIYIWYKGLLVDEDTEDIILPEDPNANIYNYLVSEAKAKIFELVWANDDDAGVQNKLQYYKNESQKHKTLALAQVRFDSITGENWHEGIKGKQIKRLRRYNNFGR